MVTGTVGALGVGMAALFNPQPRWPVRWVGFP